MDCKQKTPLKKGANCMKTCKGKEVTKLQKYFIFDKDLSYYLFEKLCLVHLD